MHIRNLLIVLVLNCLTARAEKIEERAEDSIHARPQALHLSVMGAWIRHQFEHRTSVPVIPQSYSPRGDDPLEIGRFWSCRYINAFKGFDLVERPVAVYRFRRGPDQTLVNDLFLKTKHVVVPYTHGEEEIFANWNSRRQSYGLIKQDSYYWCQTEADYHGNIRNCPLIRQYTNVRIFDPRKKAPKLALLETESKNPGDTTETETLEADWIQSSESANHRPRGGLIAEFSFSVAELLELNGYLKFLRNVAAYERDIEKFEPWKAAYSVFLRKFAHRQNKTELGPDNDPTLGGSHGLSYKDDRVALGYLLCDRSKVRDELPKVDFDLKQLQGRGDK